MQSVFAAELTIFLGFHSLRMVLFLLSHIVVTLLALGTRLFRYFFVFFLTYF